MQWIGVELEEKFVNLAKQNIELNRSVWEAHGYPVPVIIQGDSRRFSEIVQGCEGIITSPPYAETFLKNNLSQEQFEKKLERWARVSDWKRPRPTGNMSQPDYGQTPGQIGTLKAGSLDAVCTSPPYKEGLGYGGHKPTEIDKIKFAHARNEEKILSAYKKTPGSIGKETGETYWTAMNQVYSECWKALKPGGHLIVVVKAYVKNKKRVPLPQQTLKLLIHLGFKPIERIKAMLTKETVNGGLFGEDVIERKERKSFFRRLAESKGSPKIDFEEILVMRR